MLRTLVLGLIAIAATAGDPSDVDVVILDNQQRITGRLEDDPESKDWVLIKTLTGSLRLRKERVAAVELGVTSRFKAVKDDDLGGLIAFARWARTKGHQQMALAALDKAFALVRADPRRTWERTALALYCRLTDEIQGPEAALPLYRWYRSAGGQDSETIARLDQLEAIVGRSDDSGMPPVATIPTIEPEPERPASILSEGLETKGWQGENPQWSNPVQSEVVPLVGEDQLAGVKRALQVTFGKGGKDKAAIKKPVNLDASEDHTLVLHVLNKTPGPLRLSVALKTGNWEFHESMLEVIKPDGAWQELRFDLKASTFKSEKSGWSNNATLSGLDDLKEIQVLIYNKSTEGTALARYRGRR